VNQLPALIQKIARFAGSADRAAASALDRAAAATAERIAAELAAAGPWWGGDFAKAWEIGTGDVTIPADRPGKPWGPQTPRGTVPAVKAPAVTGRQFFTTGRYTIGNRMEYRNIALDLEPGRWGEDKNNTAPQDWYTTYLQGGQLNQAIKLASEPVLREAWRS
jgi:hypothetical protein